MDSASKSGESIIIKYRAAGVSYRLSHPPAAEAGQSPANTAPKDHCHANEGEPAAGNHSTPTLKFDTKRTGPQAIKNDTANRRPTVSQPTDEFCSSPAGPGTERVNHYESRIDFSQGHDWKAAESFGAIKRDLAKNLTRLLSIRLQALEKKLEDLEKGLESLAEAMTAFQSARERSKYGGESS